MGAGFLQLVGQLYVGLLVKPGPQFHHHGHLLAGTGGGLQGFDQGGIAAGAVQGLLDGQHIRIVGRLPHKVDDGGERLKGMVQQDVAVFQRIEHIDVFLQARRHFRSETGKGQFRPVHQVVDGHQPVQIHRAVDLVEIVFAQLELLQQKRAQLVRAVVRHLKPHRVVKPPRRQLAFQGDQQIIDFLVIDKQLAVAGHLELVTACGLHAGEQVVHMGMDDGGEQHEVPFARADFFRQARHPGQGPGRLNDGQPVFPAKGVFALQRDDEIKILVQHAGERVGRIQSDGAQHRQHIAVEIAFHPAGDGRLPGAPARQPYLRLGQLRHNDLVQHGVLGGDQLMRLDAYLFEGFHRAQVVRPGLHGTVFHLLLEASHANFEEFIQVGAGYAKELESLQQRGALVLGLSDDAPVEL